MALGATLVADDQTEILLEEGRVMARCPQNLNGVIEARGIGLLTAPASGPAEIALVADLGQPEPDRLPPRRKVTILGRELDLVLGRGNDHFPAAVLCYLQGTRQA